MLRSEIFSVGPDGDVIASSRDETLLLRGKRAEEALEAAGNGATPSFFGESRRFDRAESLVLADAHSKLVDHYWNDNAELQRSLITRSEQKHRYAFCFYQLRVFFDFVSSLPSEVPTTPVLVYGTRIIVGPTIVSGYGPCGECWTTYLEANIPSLGERVRRSHRLVESPDDDATAVIALARALWEAPRSASPPDSLLEIDAETGTIVRRRLLPFPNCACGPCIPGWSLDDVEGGSTGIVFATGDPREHGTALEIVTAQSRIDSGASGGACGLDPIEVRQRALAEAIERAASGVPRADALKGCHRDVSDAPPLEEINRFSSAQYGRDGFLYHSLEAGTATWWVSGIDWTSGQKCSLPEQMIARCRRTDDKVLDYLSSTGIAASRSPVGSRQSALLEVAERDIAVRSWLTRRFRSVDAEALAATWLQRIREAGMQSYVAVCDDDSAPVAVAFVHQAQNQDAGAYGVASGVALVMAVSHALEEAVLMFHFRRDRGRLVPLDPRMTETPPLPTNLYDRTCDFDSLIRRYRPKVFDLTIGAARAVGLSVMSVWSPVAVDFPDARGTYREQRLHSLDPRVRHSVFEPFTCSND